MTETASPKGGTKDEPKKKRHQPKKKCPICGKKVKGLPYHITQAHAE